MGLDTVELVMAVEEEFGLEIPNSEAEKITTVGEMYEYLRRALGSTPPAECITQRMFYKVRQAIAEEYGVPRRAITLDTRLRDLVPPDALKETWPYLDLFAELEFPKLDPAFWPLGAHFRTEVLTLRQIVKAMAILNDEKLLLEPRSDEGIWVRLTRLIQVQVNVNVDEIQPNASFTKDLGMD